MFDQGVSIMSGVENSLVGDYIVKATIAETANYEGTEVTAEFSISASAAVMHKLQITNIVSNDST